MPLKSLTIQNTILAWWLSAGIIQKKANTIYPAAACCWTYTTSCGDQEMYHFTMMNTSLRRLLGVDFWIIYKSCQNFKRRMNFLLNRLPKPTGGSLSNRSRFSSFLSYIPNLNCIAALTLGNAAPLANAEAGYVPIPRLPLRGYLPDILRNKRESLRAAADRAAILDGFIMMIRKRHDFRDYTRFWTSHGSRSLQTTSSWGTKRWRILNVLFMRKHYERDFSIHD